MTKSALENKKLETQERIANRDRELEEKQFKHKRRMDIVNALTGGMLALFSGGKGSKRNGPEFYKNYIKELDKFTNLTTWVRNGNETYLGRYKGVLSHSGGVITGISQETAVPGIAVVKWVPSIGPIPASASAISQSPINQILMRTKEQVLKSNSRSNVPYDSGDLGLNFFATGSILVAIGEFEKLVMVAQTYKADNAYYADGYLKALGVTTPLNWTKDLANAQQKLVLLKKRFNSALVAPAQMSLYRKYAYLASAWMKDSEASPASVYTFRAVKYFKLNAAGDGLDIITPNVSTPDLFYDQISSMIQAIAENPDFQAMYADLRSAFNDLLKLDEKVDGNIMLSESFDSMGIEQIANIQTLPIIYTDDWTAGAAVDESLKVHEDSAGYLYQGASTSRMGVEVVYDTSEELQQPDIFIKDFYNTQHLFNFHKDNITGDDVLDISRWHYTIAGTRRVNDDNQLFVRVASSDVAIAVSIEIHNFSISGGVLSLDSKPTGTYYVDAGISAGQPDILEVLAKYLAFDWSPIATAHYLSGSAVYIHTYGDVQHLVPVNGVNVDKLNQVCVLSELFIDSTAFRTPK